MSTTEALAQVIQNSALTPCKLATTENITLSGLQTLDGVALAGGERVLVKNQTDLTENGVWLASASAWSRASDFNDSNDIVSGSVVAVWSGTAYTNSIWQVTFTGTASFGVTEFAWGQVGVVTDIDGNWINILSAAIGSGWDSTFAGPIDAGWKSQFSLPPVNTLDDIKGVRYASDIAAMRALSSDELTNNCVVYVSDSSDAGSFLYDSASSETVDNDTIYASSVGVAGRFIRRPETVNVGNTRRSIIRVLEDNTLPTSITEYGGVGDGSTSDVAAIEACLADRGHCGLPYYQPNTTTAAVWNFPTTIALTSGMSVIGDPRLPKVKQGDTDLFKITGGHKQMHIKNMRIDSSSTTSSGKAAFHFNTNAGSIERVYIESIVQGIDRDLTTLINGYEFYRDDNHASNQIVTLRMPDCQIWGPKTTAITFNDVFADAFIDRSGVDFTRQSAAPTYPGIKVTFGEGIFFRDAYVQGLGTTGTGNSAGHGFEVTGGAAIGFERTRADAVGGIGYKIASATAIEMVMPIASLCGSGGYDFNAVTFTAPLLAPYAGGRSGLGWAPTGAVGLKVTGGTKVGISAPRIVSNTGAGIELASSNANAISGGHILSNGDYGIKESGTSNYNAVVGCNFDANTTSNGYFTGAASFVSGIMRASGVGLGYNVPGAATAW